MKKKILKNFFQKIEFVGNSFIGQSKKLGEIAPYVIFNINDLLDNFKKLNIDNLYAYGYNGRPSETSVTPYNELCFCVFSLKKSFKEINDNQFKMKIDLPKNIIDEIK